MIPWSARILLSSGSKTQAALLLLLYYLLLGTPVHERLLHEVQYLDGTANAALRCEALLLFLDPPFEIDDLRVPVQELILGLWHTKNTTSPVPSLPMILINCSVGRSGSIAFGFL